MVEPRPNGKGFFFTEKRAEYGGMFWCQWLRTRIFVYRTNFFIFFTYYIVMLPTIHIIDFAQLARAIWLWGEKCADSEPSSVLKRNKHVSSQFLEVASSPSEFRVAPNTPARLFCRRLWRARALPCRCRHSLRPHRCIACARICPLVFVEWL